MTTRPVALIHDWLTGMRGGERCLEVFAELLPGAPILTLIHEPGSVSDCIEKHEIIASPLSRSRAARRNYRKLLPLLPWATRKLPAADYDVLVSLSHCAAKAATKRPGAKHISYCFTPARYLWDHADTYLRRSSAAVRAAARLLLPRLRQWDVDTAGGVDRFIAISEYVAERIRRIYGRDADIIYPPVDTSRFTIAADSDVRDHYLVVSALTPYKGVDLAIAACNATGKRLIVIGKGEDERRLHSLAGPTIEFRGWQPDHVVADEMATCRAFVLPCEEDFGITPLEAMASGRPVVALGRGGACETVTAATGVFFDEPSTESAVAALQTMDERHGDFDPVSLRAHAASFDLPVFRQRIAALLREEGVVLVPEGQP
ncbi:MAG: glycosyltransferase [Planctomycetota bacterium]